jgi:peptidoglycan/LPS O-acetylase OafA/YrhL
MFDQHPSSRRRRRPASWLAVALAIVALAAPSAALAQVGSSPTKAQYEPTNRQVSSGGGGGTIGGLPFTGLDIGVLAIAAAALLGAGIALRRLSDPERRSSSS